ncbi:MAG TPA: ATP-dependent sacrificial sulfur transferase LarE [Acidimicrobiales bacterium]|nr:ATP-dependent sacrificial sulfur transferase LarE [Acidimicrobiales bacterium]
MTPEQTLARLESFLEPFPSAAVAFSGGVDSTLVLAIANRAISGRVLAITGISPSVAPSEATEARRTAERIGAELVFADTHEMDNPLYVANSGDRCYHCKSELYDVCHRMAEAEDLAVVLDGANADDTGDHRPGMVAAHEKGVVSPLLECGVGKREIRDLARQLGLPTWDKPALACLSSRLPVGTEVTMERLRAVDTVEQHLRSLGFEQVRARHLGEKVRIEVEPELIADLHREAESGNLAELVTAAGFRTYEIDPRGYRQGSLNLL